MKNEITPNQLSTASEHQALATSHSSTYDAWDIVPPDPEVPPPLAQGESDQPSKILIEPETEGSTAVTTSQKSRTPRGADTRYDRLSTRHHVICLAGVLADEANGGYDEARAIEVRQEKPIRPRVPHKDVVQICPWVINAAYINLQGSLGLAQKGLDRSFKDWLANRVYFFSYRLPNKSEHPAQRARGISSIYKKFYDTFSEDISAKVLISEERAKAFWKSVAAQVPYLWPEPVVGESSVNLVAKEGGSHE
jgi:hypothetical protein